MQSLRLVLLLAGALGMTAALPARAQLDISGTWISPQYYLGPETCIMEFVQSGTDLQLEQNCQGLGPDAVASGTIDLMTRTFTASGGCGFGAPAGSAFDISGTVSADGLTINGSFFCAAFPGSVPYTAARCGNGVIDEGEDCEPPATCCSNCQFAAGASCQAAACVTGACDSAGSCVPGAPEPSGTTCAVDGDNCTIEECDGAGACVVSQVVPCHDVCAFCDATHTCIGAARNLGSSQIFDPNGCWRPLNADSRVVFRNAASGRLSWSLGRESQTTLTSFGVPTGTTGLQLCAFYRSGYGTDWKVLTAARADPGANWKATSSGFRFRDSTAAGGLSKLRLKSGSEPGNTRITVGGKGPVLDLPPDFTALGFGMQGQVQVEIRADNGQCWGTDFSTEYGLRVRQSVMRGSNGG